MVTNKEIYKIRKDWNNKILIELDDVFDGYIKADSVSLLENVMKHLLNKYNNKVLDDVINNIK